MRDHWEAGKGADLDAPTTITEREVRSIRRRSGVAVLALLLALLSMGAVVWSVLAGPDGRAAILDLKGRLLGDRADAAGNPSYPSGGAPPASGGVQDSSLIPPAAPDSMPGPVPPR